MFSAECLGLLAYLLSLLIHLPLFDLGINWIILFLMFLTSRRPIQVVVI